MPGRLAQREAGAAQDQAEGGEGQRRPSVENTVWNTVGNPVHMTTKTKTSQTLLTSQTGAMA